MKDNLRDKSKDFANKIINLYKYLDDNKEFIISKQILRSGTSVGANIRESEYASSRKDFISKLQISLKECNESAYWLELLFENNYIQEDMYNELYSICMSILKMLKSSIRTLKEKENINE